MGIRQMIYKIGTKIWSLKDNTIKSHIVEDSKFITWIQKVKIDGEWFPASDYYPSRPYSNSPNHIRPKP
jgi:hypothetical protein